MINLCQTSVNCFVLETTSTDVPLYLPLSSDNGRTKRLHACATADHSLAAGATFAAGPAFTAGLSSQVCDRLMDPQALLVLVWLLPCCPLHLLRALPGSVKIKDEKSARQAICLQSRLHSNPSGEI